VGLPERNEEIQLGACVIAVSLWIGSRSERDLLKYIAVDHRDRPGVLHSLDRVDEQRSGHAFKRKVHVPDRQPADAELAPQIVSGRDAGQHVNGAHRIVGDHTAKLLQFVAPEDLQSAACLVCIGRATDDVDRFAVCARSCRDRNGDVQHVAHRHVDDPADKDEINGRDIELVAP
jgi:hypothetical protein